MTDLDLKDRAGGAVVETPAEKPGIFISYARSDSSALAEELVEGLEVAGFRPFLDRHDIAAAEAWEARLGALILGAELGKTAGPGSGGAGAGGGSAGAAATPQLHLFPRRLVIRAAARRIGGGVAAGCRMGFGNIRA